MSIVLGKRAVKAKDWRWIPGMLALPRRGGFPARVDCVLISDMSDTMNVQYVPDFSDPATMGCLLALVRGIRNDPLLHVVCDGRDWLEAHVEHWVVYDLNGFEVSEGWSEAEALVAALEVTCHDSKSPQT